MRRHEGIVLSDSGQSEKATYRTIPLEKRMYDILEKTKLGDSMKIW